MRLDCRSGDMSGSASLRNLPGLDAGTTAHADALRDRFVEHDKLARLPRGEFPGHRLRYPKAAGAIKRFVRDNIHP